MIEELPKNLDLEKMTLTFLDEISECDDPELLPLVIERFRGSIQNQRLKFEIEKLKTPDLTTSNLPSLMNNGL